MVILDVDTLVGASLKQGRLAASGIDAKVFDPHAGGYMRSASSPTTRNCQLLVATADAEDAARVLSFDASADLADLEFGGDHDDPDDGLRYQPRSHKIGRLAMRLAALVIGLAILYSLAGTVLSILS